jgi:hypothetical protein
VGEAANLHQRKDQNCWGKIESDCQGTWVRAWHHRRAIADEGEHMEIMYINYDDHGRKKKGDIQKGGQREKSCS